MRRSSDLHLVLLQQTLSYCLCSHIALVYLMMMIRRAQILTGRCSGNFPQMIRSKRPTKITPPVVPSNVFTPSNTQPLLQEGPKFYYSTSWVQSSSVSSNIANAENAVSSSSGKDEPSGDTSAQTVPITFIEADGKERLVQAEIGKHLLDVAHDNHVELEGACGGELSCSTCHLIFEPHVYEKLAPKLDDEQDMLDLAFAVTETYESICHI